MTAEVWTPRRQGLKTVNRDIIVIGTSAGGLKALKNLMGQLPAKFPAAVFIAFHMLANRPSYMAEILKAETELDVANAVDDEPIRTGRIYLATPDHHLMVEEDRVCVTRGPKENRFRPSVDVLFRSAAAAFGARVIGVVLTGLLDDGASGLYAVKSRGGAAIVQDPIEAEYPEMPLNALRAVKVDHSVSLAEMGNLLTRLVAEPLDPQNAAPVPENMRIEVEIAGEANAIEIGSLNLGEKTTLTCPDCHGALVEIRENALTRFRCHTGHAFTLGVLLKEVGKDIEDSLWQALSKIEENEMLLSRLARNLKGNELHEDAEKIGREIENAKRKAKLVREAVFSKQ